MVEHQAIELPVTHYRASAAYVLPARRHTRVLRLVAPALLVVVADSVKTSPCTLACRNCGCANNSGIIDMVTSWCTVDVASSTEKRPP
jgi:hypothetical protein